MTTHIKLLRAASAFIREQAAGPDEAVRNLMADAIDEAIPSDIAIPLSPIAPKPARAKAPRANGVSHKPAAPVAGAISDDNMRTLLRAAGYKQVKTNLLCVYRVLLSDQSKAWTGREVSKILGWKPTRAGALMNKLAARKAVVKDGYGRYRAT